MSSMLHGCLADTDYVELTAQSGRSYGIWVTMPPGHTDATGPLPLMYVLDGNWTVGVTAPLVVVQADPYLTVAPYIQVSIGYAGEDAGHWERLRNRDFVPPGEPVAEDMVSTLEAARDSGAMSQEKMAAYLTELADTRADLFLDFLTDELHPHLRSRYPVADSGHGLFGYSYGGLFALYAWLRGAAPFASFGAGSPGVITPASRIFTMIDALPARPADPVAPRLHVTVNELEALGDVAIYRRLAQNVLDVVDRLQRTDRAPDVTRALLRETHVTGLQASFLDYLKVCHSRPGAGD
ncbi:alpha/beta hydrolase [Pseudonocardia sp. HH130630-07]|uniref:alpha/beta hydrolase n=1 Tax=Pseudonocardia sp. HH130630-07 TaxID=1690815 RepID=UPI000814D824|nr:alpha/beta hydrolase-fold protein [Pseudonocardia sp. HH130630-07]ANY05757.1 esterase [Pseudonocardia sp. HH130630-07]ANY07015.1 esterase [Pseudonocardia sp. HH130630-07]